MPDGRSLQLGIAVTMLGDDIASISRYLAARKKGLRTPDVNRIQHANEYLLRDPRRYW
jgi:hypothetical protein